MTDPEPSARPKIPHWLPNAITAVRVALIPVMIAFARVEDADAAAGVESAAAWLTFVTVLTIGFSDVVDGYLARRFGLTTRFGATFDAIADKLTQVAFLIYFSLFAGPGFTRLPLWFLGVIILRDLVLAYGWALLWRRYGKVRVVHRFHGKASSMLMFALFVWITAGGDEFPVTVAAAVIAVVIVVSTISYGRDGWRQWKHPEVGDR